MKICSYRKNGGLLVFYSRCVYSDILNRKFPLKAVSPRKVWSFADFDLYIGGETGKVRNLGFRQGKTIIMPLIPISYSSVSCCRRCLRCAKRCSFCSAVSCWRLLLRCSRWIWSRHSPEDFHFANYRFSFRFVPFRFVSFPFANYSKPSFCMSAYFSHFSFVMYNFHVIFL